MARMLKKEESSSRTISSLTRNRSSDAVHANVLLISSRSLMCATPAARRRAPVALCTMSQSSLLRPFRYPCIQSGQSGFVSSRPSSSRAPNTFRHQEQNKWTRHRAAGSTFPVVIVKHVTSRQVCDRGCQTSAVFSPSDGNVHSPQQLPTQTEFCRVDLKTANASSFLVMNGVVTWRKRQDQHFGRHTPRWDSFPLRRPLESTNHFPDVVFRFLSNVLVIHSQLIACLQKLFCHRSVVPTGGTHASFRRW